MTRDPIRTLLPGWVKLVFDPGRRSIGWLRTSPRSTAFTVRETGLSFLAASADVSQPSISEAYVLPHCAGMDFAYTGIDAVYVWTRGGYQVARDPDDYPLFVAIVEVDLEEWERYFEQFGLTVAQERQPTDAVQGPIQIVLDLRDTVEAELVDGRPVIPLDETVELANEHDATFQSAVDPLDRM